ncbi:MAG TPA: sigma-70 family RNA polymerase sigma factor [Lacipirellulaceae bacterium]|jgi:RNA polymerase sigma-70 factor (ECF subfamily)|nr:sigma-70 family RNA polymerase sigma factor [Lacipirellulaceae bacterium]
MPNDDSTVRQGEHAANAIDWPAEFDRHGRWLRTVALARVGDAAAADDVLQEVSLTALAKGHQLRDPTRVAGWLYRLVVVAALQYRRRQGRRQKLLDRYANQLPSNDTDSRESDPLTWLLADERKSMIRQGLEKLPPRDAEIMLLKYSEDWSYQQLADHLGLSVSAVEARLHRARQKMRQVLNKLDPSLKTGRS